MEHPSLFVPSARHNAVSMRDGRTYKTHLADLATFMEGGGELQHPLNEVAWGETRVFFELDGPFSDDLEDAMVNKLLRSGRHVDADETYHVVLRVGNPERFHVVYPNLVLPVAEYNALIQSLQAETVDGEPRFPSLDKTCNDQKAWLRFPLAPKPEREGMTDKERRLTKRRYHLQGGKYRDAFINPSPLSLGQMVRSSGVVGQDDMKRLKLHFPNTRFAKKGYVNGSLRTYFTTGPAWCKWHDRKHRRYPLCIHVTDDAVWQGRCQKQQRHQGRLSQTSKET